MEENFATRLKVFIDKINMPTTTVADLCDIPRPSFSQLLSGRNQKVSDVLIRKIHKAYPDLSVMWLMFGEGPMLISEDKASESEKDDTSEVDVESDHEKREKAVIARDSLEFSNLAKVSSTQVVNQPAENIITHIEENKRIQELQLQIENLQKNPRRVTKITVFYDDKSFDTFVPEK